MIETLWPESVPIVSVGRTQKYRTPDGDMDRVTKFLKVLGTGTEFLIRWAADTERTAAIMAATDVYAEGSHGEGPAEFAQAVEQALAGARKHVKDLTLAADIGTDAHLRVQWLMRRELGISEPEPEMKDERSLWASLAFEDWWKGSGLKAIRSEQPVWDRELGYAGTIDIVAEGPEGLGVVDLKTSKGVYDSHHLQVMAYLHAGRNFAPLKWAKIVRLPKKMDDPNFEVVPLGRLYGRELNEFQLMEAFKSCLILHKILVAKT